MKTKDLKLPVEHRAFIAGSALEVRAAADGEMPTLVGYAAVFNSRIDFGWMQEEVAPGAFARSLAENDDVRALADHDTGVSQVLGRRSAGTLRLSEDTTGLRVEIDLPDTATARDLVTQLAAKNIDGMSFGFRARSVEWNEEAEPAIRTLLDVELIEVSVVTFPAYPDTSIAKRSLEEATREFQAGPNASEERTNKPQPSLGVLRLRAARRK